MFSILIIILFWCTNTFELTGILKFICHYYPHYQNCYDIQKNVFYTTIDIVDFYVYKEVKNRNVVCNDI